jgi:hypothetical protein
VICFFDTASVFCSDISFICRAPVRLTQFTGGAHVSEQLCREFAGKVKIEDAGFDWK